MLQNLIAKIKEWLEQHPRIHNGSLYVLAIVLVSAVSWLLVMLPLAWGRGIAGICFAAGVALLFRLVFAGRLMADFEDRIVEPLQKLGSDIARFPKKLTALKTEVAELPSEIEKLIRRPSDEVLSANGVVNIFANRQKAKKDIEQTINNAQDRVWLLGVTLYSDFELHNKLHELNEKRKHLKKDLRILLSNPLRSPAIFRMLLEREPPEADRILKYYTSKTPNGESEELFDQKTMHEFEQIRTFLRKYPDLARSVRFYAHLFAFWGAIIDDYIYYQPCFLSPHDSVPRDSSDHPLASVLGSGPVIKLERGNGDTREFFDSLEEHFQCLWFMTTTDVLHMDVQWVEKSSILKELFSRRNKWLSEVCSYRLEKWRRNAQRHSCDATQLPTFHVTYKGETVTGTLVDYSFDSLGIRVNQPQSSLENDLQNAETDEEKRSLNVEVKLHSGGNPREAGKIVARCVIPKNEIMHPARLEPPNSENNPHAHWLLGIVNDPARINNPLDTAR